MTNLFTKTTILLVSLALVVSACAPKKPAENLPVNQNENLKATTSTAQIDTSDWKTYRNEEYGFEFRYPDNLALVSEKDYQLVFKSSNLIAGVPDESLTIKIFSNVDLAEFIKNEQDRINDNIFNYTFRQVSEIEGKHVYFLSAYKDALGLGINYTYLIYYAQKNIGLSFNFSSTSQDKDLFGAKSESIIASLVY